MDTILPLEEARAGWVNEVFSNPSDEYDKVWHNKLVFQEVRNGDYLAIDLNIISYGKIIYLSHDDGGGHGYVMADSFTELLSKWSVLGCVGAEDWQWLPFCEDKYSGIDPNCENAQLWKQTLGLPT
ncbi:MAG: SMI1/KNR4 family protein [Hymenobacter sp.]|nr:MAG: SMI1/KNR4 family protein [Hymenobacter sp.]